MKQITDPQGVSWFEIPITKQDLKKSIEAFGGGLLFLKEEQKQSLDELFNK